MNAEISKLHSKIAAISYRLDALFSSLPQATPAQYLIGQTITSAAPIGPGTKLGRCVFFPCDGGVYTYGGTSYRTPDFAGALVRACTESTPDWVGLKGVLGAVDAHKHDCVNPRSANSAMMLDNTFCSARGGLFDIDNVGSSDSYPFLCPTKYENPNWPPRNKDVEVFNPNPLDLDQWSGQQYIYGETSFPWNSGAGVEALKVGLYFAICLLIE